MRGHEGFTLIEIVVALLLCGVLALIAGMGIVQGVEGYLMSRENAAIAQKSQLALERLRREILILNGITAASGTSLQFSNPMGSRTVGLHGQTVKIAEGTTPLSSGDSLVGGVGGFSLGYFKNDGSAWVQGTDVLQDLAAVQIALTLNHSQMNGGGLAFSTVVNPRNNGMLNAPIE